MKKLLILGIFAAAVIFTATPAWAYTANQGDLIKVYGNPAVYYIDGSGSRHLFSTEATFFSWYTGTWRDQSIISVSSGEFNQIPSGKNVTMRPGYSLVRFDNSMVMYAVTAYGQLCHAPAHYGNYQYNRARVIPAGFQIDYNTNTNCDITQSANLPDGTLFKYANSGEVYYVQNGLKRYVTTNGMTANRLHYESIVNNVDPNMYFSSGATLDSYDASISDLNAYLYGNGYSYNYPTCSENWSCNSWTTCINGSQYRSCNDLNNCGTTANKPINNQSCYSYNYICKENWTCGAWSSCAYGRNYRTCWDLNACGTTVSKPIENQTCYTCQENWTCGNWGTCQKSGLSNGWQFRTCTDLNACGTFRSQPTTSQTCVSACSTNWSCTGWTTCNGNMQTRSCIDLNSCNSNTGKPTTSQSCR